MSHVVSSLLTTTRKLNVYDMDWRHLNHNEGIKLDRHIVAVGPLGGRIGMFQPPSNLARFLQRPQKQNVNAGFRLIIPPPILSASFPPAASTRIRSQPVLHSDCDKIYLSCISCTSCPACSPFATPPFNTTRAHPIVERLVKACVSLRRTTFNARTQRPEQMHI